MTIIRGFRADTIWKAFTLNSIASALVIVIAITVKDHFDTYLDKKNNVIKRVTTIQTLLITFLIAFLTSYVAYTIMYFLFGFGGGMLVSK